MTKRIPAFVGLDIETTGLDPKEGVILELGMATFDHALKPITARSWLTDEQVDHFGDVDAVVLNMHEKSGLIHDLIHGDHPTLAEVEAHALCWLRDNHAEGLPMVGSSITFDRTWLAIHAPRLLSKFHYHSIDATSVRLTALTQTPTPLTTEATNRINHRAGELRGKYLEQLDVAEEQKRPHRTIYDICASAGLATASMECAGHDI